MAEVMFALTLSKEKKQVANITRETGKAQEYQIFGNFGKRIL
jgi:hypothetical protein